MIKCTKHPRYLGKHKPRSKCRACWKLHRHASGKLKDFLTYRNWIQGSMATDTGGNDVYETSPKAARFCLVGGLRYIYVWGTPEYREAQQKLAKVLGINANNLTNWNDESSRRFSEVKKALEKANV